MSVPARGGATQRRVRATMIAAGGYWRPLAAVARLLEELGELAELLEGSAPGLDGELADVWIITTALADQFLAEVPEPGANAAGPASGTALLIAASPIARVVNHYDGPKVPRAQVPLPTLHGAVQDLHAALGSLARARGVDLAAAVDAKLELIHRRGDLERFGRQGFDPSTAPVLERLSAAGPGAALPDRLWGAPEPDGEVSAEERSAAARPALTSFAKAARAERIEGLVIAGPSLVPGASRAAWLGALVFALDPSGSAERFEIAGSELGARGLASPGAGESFALVTVS